MHKEEFDEKNKTFTINGRKIGDGFPTYIIAEMSANHAGSIDRALEMIHVAKEIGADCVKIQTYTPDTMTIDCHNEYFKIGKGTWKGENLYSLYQKAYTPWEWQYKLMDEARKTGIDFLSTPFDNTSVDFLESLGIGFYKIASFELVDIPFIEYVASKNKPIIMSTGMASLDEINEAVEAIYSTGNRQVALMKCSSAYPAKIENMNLVTISDMKKRFVMPIGLSDHSMGAFSATMAVALGANIIEKHFCISRTIKNPDSTFSMEPNEFKSMVKQVREVEKAIGKVKYGVSKQEEDNICFRRSLFVVQDIAEGEELTPNNIRSIRPAYGLKPKYYKEVVGKKAAHDLKRGTPLAYADVVHLSLREATYEDMDLLFQWVNDKEVRSNSFNTNIISYESHVNWFNNVMLDHSALQLIMCSDEKPIGQIRLNIDDNNNACISYSISPDKRGLGLGTEMIKLLKVKLVADHYQFKSIIGHVKYENKASQKCFEKCGFIKTDNKNYIEYKLLIE